MNAAELVIRRTISLCKVPAPPLYEADRAQIVRGWWEADGVREVRVDDAGNVRGRLRGDDSERKGLALCAHLDTVFGPDVKHGVRRDGTRLTGPGVGDNTVAVASLSALGALLPQRLRHPVWIVATTGEEGLGNLAGIRALLADPPGPVRAVIALEGNYLGRVSVTGVGSVRWRVTVTGPGGHAWEDPEHPSAVHEAARLITRLDALASSTGARPEATVNIGRFEGGESVNSRARRATFLVDLRSEDAATLASLRDAAAEVLLTATGVDVAVETLGERPVGGLDPAHPLARTAADVLREHGIEPRPTAASTDANAAYALDIPALTLGITTGAGTHTEQEWIDGEPIETGLTALATTIARLDEQEW